MNKLIKIIEKYSENTLQLYGALISILLTAVAAILLYNWGDNKLILYSAIAIFIFIGFLLVYVGHFLKTRPVRTGFVLSFITSILTGVILGIYLKYFRDEKSFTTPIAFIAQLIIAKLLKGLIKKK